MTVALPTAAVRVEAPRPTLVIGYEGPRPWQQKWQEVLYGLEQLERLYASESTQGSLHIQQIVEGFFKACRELADWLWQDERTNIRKSEVLQFVLSDQDLRIADGMAQTIKHHTRDRNNKRDPITAEIKETAQAPDGVRVVIRWSRPSFARYYARDALNLARGCVKAWQGFLAENGLKP